MLIILQQEALLFGDIAATALGFHFTGNFLLKLSGLMGGVEFLGTAKLVYTREYSNIMAKTKDTRAVSTVPNLRQSKHFLSQIS